MTTHPLHRNEEFRNTIRNTDAAAWVALQDAVLDEVVIRDAEPVDHQKFDSVAS